MRRTRDSHINDPIYLEWEREYKTEQDAARAAVEAADPVALAQRAMTDAALAMHDALRTQKLSSDILPGERIDGRKINEEVAIANFKLFARTQPGFDKDIHGRQLLDMMEFQDLAPVVENYRALFVLMNECGAFVERVRSVPQTESELVLTPSEKYRVDQANKDKVIGIVDGVEITERLLATMPSRDELRIRRKLEKGHAGDSTFDTYLEIKNIQFARDQEIAKRAAREMGEQNA